MNKTPTIVAIGTSAGTLKELELFFEGIPKSTELAFIIIHHLLPDQESELTEKLSHYIEMEVYRLKNKMKIESGKVYILPPNNEAVLKNDKILLKNRPENHELYLPVDIFFKSLKESAGANSIAVILSGKGSDGSSGIKAVKEGGGLTIIQQPDTTDSNEMPLNALYTGLIDFSLPIKEMPGVILQYNEKLKGESIFIKNEAQSKDILKQILKIIQIQTGHDFSNYKEQTIARRIERRITVSKVNNLEKYKDLLHQSKDEVTTLFKELLIGVTSFFRDKDIFYYIENTLIPEIVSQSKGQKIRIWVPACSTGEEAYTWAMMLKNYFDVRNIDKDFQVFATDIDAEAIEKARKGLYTSNIMAEVPPQLLEQYFTKEQTGYKIKKMIRDSIVFAVQNFLQDPPYSKLDIISCRNALIYFGNKFQQKAISIFHYSLNPSGILVLGSKETLGYFKQYFETTDAKYKIFRKNNFHEATSYVWDVLNEKQKKPRQEEKLVKESISSIARNFILKSYSPPGVLINSDGTILHREGDTKKFFKTRPGKYANNIIAKAKDALKKPLLIAINSAKNNRSEVLHSLTLNESDEHIDIIISPVNHKTTDKQLYMVVFRSELKEKTFNIKEGDIHNSTIHKLNKELKEKEQFLQNTIEELEATNEEAQSTNEELQSTNELLETSKEELQSANEELSATNNELNIKVTELDKVNSQLNNLLDATEIATIFLNKELKIFSFTPAIKTFIDLLPSDIGRSIKQFTNIIKRENLVNDVKEVLKTLHPKGAEVHNKQNRYFWMRILPYRTGDNKVEGVVITFTDITEKKLKDEELEKHRNHLEELIEEKSQKLVESEKKFRNITENIPGLVLRYKIYSDGSDELVYLSNTVENIYEITHEEAVNNVALLWERIHPDDMAIYQASIEKSAKDLSFWHMEHRILLPDGKVKWLDARGVPHKDEAGSIIWDTIGIEITEQKNAELLLKESEEKYRTVFERGLSAIVVADDQGNYLAANQAAAELFGYSTNELLQMKVSELQTSLNPNAAERYKKYLNTGEEAGEFDFISKNGEKKVAIYKAVRIKQNFNLSMLFDITSRKKAEAALKASEEKYRRLYENLPDMVYRMSLPDGKYEFTNNAAIEIMGYTPKEFYKNPLLIKKIIHPDFREFFEKSWTNLIEGIVPPHYYYQIIHKSGKIKWIDQRNVLIKDDKGNPVAIEGIITDITERRNAEIALKTSEEKFKEIFNSVSESIVLHDNTMGKIIDCNKATLDMYGYESKEEIIGLEIKDLSAETAGYDQSKILTLLKRATRSHNYTFEWMAKKNNDEIFWVEVSLQKTLLGGKGMLLAVTRNITDRKEAESALKESEERFRELINNQGEGVGLVNEKKEFVFVNPAAEKIFGVKSGGLTRKMILNFVSKESKKLIENTIKTCKKEEKSVFEINILRSKNQLVPVLMTATPRFDSNDQYTGLFFVFRDISELKRAQKLQNELVIAKNTAKVKQQFLANISHEMRTPMNGIIGMSEFLSQTKLSEQQKDYVHTIKESSESLLNTINDVLNLSKLEQGKTTLHFESFNIIALAKSTVSIFTAQAMQKKIKIQVKPQSSFPGYIIMDKQHIRQILYNLISNAVKYTEKGSIDIYLQKMKGGAYETIKILVKDTGIGIKEEDKTRIFDPFVRLDESLTRTTEGTGLGLSITKNLVEKIGGTLHCESEEGKGSIFWFTFQAKESEEKEPHQDISINKKNLGLHILMAEDKKLNQKVGGIMLHNLGCTYEIAVNGEEVLEKFQENKFDIILMDIMMPKMDGIAAMKQLRKKYRDVPPIIGLSAHALEGDAEKFIAKGLDDYLEKPINVAKLAEKLNNWGKK